MSGPSYYNDAWSRRAPLLIEAAGSATKDTNWTPNSTWDDFWSNIQDANALDVVVTEADGVTVIDRQWSGLDIANRGGTLQLDDVSLTTNQMNVVWVYWDSASTVSATSHTPATPLTAVESLYKPAVASILLSTRKLGSGGNPVDVIYKAGTEVRPVWVDVTSWLQGRRTVQQGNSGGDGISAIDFVVSRSGTPDTTMSDLTLTRYIVTQNGRHLIQVIVKAGTSGQTSLCTLTAQTVNGFTFDFRFLVTINNQTEA